MFLAGAAPVLSLTVIDGETLSDGLVADGTSVLTVVRAADTNPTHPNVVSVPTQRVPQPLFDAIVAAAAARTVGSPQPTTYYDAAPVDNDDHNGHDAVMYATESLLARKLGLAEVLERGEVHFRAALRSVVVGTAVYEGPAGGAPTSERINMLNVLVEVAAGRDRVPAATSSYSHVRWTSVHRFLAGVDRRDPMAIHPEMDPIELCVHGVCLTAAQATLQLVHGQAPFAPADSARATSARHVTEGVSHNV